MVLINMDPSENPNIPFASIYVEKTGSKLATDMAEVQIHPFYELYFLLSGERRYFIGHKIFNVAPGNLVIIPKDEVHKTGALNRKGYERYVMYFSQKSIEDLIQNIGEDRFIQFANMGCIQFPPEQSMRIREIMDRLFVEEDNNDDLSYSVKKALLYDIITTSLRYGTEKSCATGDGADRIQQAAKYISENYSSEITLSGMARMACMEKTYFSKRFKALTGFGFNTYLTQTRLKAAQELLISTKMSINEISDSCGFSGSNYFGDVFAKHYGLPPSEYRKTTNPSC